MNIPTIIFLVILIGFCMSILGPIPTILFASIGFVAEDIIKTIKKVSKLK
ncbi:MAG TPA: hypothetical protein PLH46_04285 [Caldisericia bacterium]|nr:hypothetical protein [Caldisericia bacterium]